MQMKFYLLLLTLVIHSYAIVYMEKRRIEESSKIDIISSDGFKESLLMDDATSESNLIRTILNLDSETQELVMPFKKETNRAVIVLIH
jgi:hypothetical protein